MPALLQSYGNSVLIRRRLRHHENPGYRWFRTSRSSLNYSRRGRKRMTSLW